MDTERDVVTGASTEVELVVDRSIEEVWALVTDVSRIGEWSPECVFAAWRPGQDELPRVGAWFDARNEYADGYTATVECVVTAAERPSVFEWVVLDDDLDTARPGSIWRYELEPDERGQGTRVRHRFTHGPGMTGLREGAHAVVDRRLAQLNRNMTATLHAMVDAKETRG